MSINTAAATETLRSSLHTHMTSPRSEPRHVLEGLRALEVLRKIAVAVLRRLHPQPSLRDLNKLAQKQSWQIFAPGRTGTLLRKRLTKSERNSAEATVLAPVGRGLRGRMGSVVGVG